MKNFSVSEAKQLIKSAIESNSIKLQGSGGTKEHSESGAERDAAYLLKLLNALTADPAG